MRKGNCDIEINDTEYSKYAKIKPAGFWAYIVTVSQDTDIRDMKLKEPEISWSCGGTDGTVTGDALVDNFIEALTYAKEIGKEWAGRLEPLAVVKGVGGENR